MEKIWNKGKEWEVNEYNKRLSKENQLLDELDKERELLDEKERKEINKIWDISE